MAQSRVRSPWCSMTPTCVEGRSTGVACMQGRRAGLSLSAGHIAPAPQHTHATTRQRPPSLSTCQSVCTVVCLSACRPACVSGSGSVCLYAYLPPVYLSFGLPLTHTTTLQCSTCTQVTRATRVMGAIRILTDTHHPRANPRAPPPVPWRPFLARRPADSRTLPRVVPGA